MTAYTPPLRRWRRKHLFGNHHCRSRDPLSAPVPLPADFSVSPVCDAVFGLMASYCSFLVRIPVQTHTISGRIMTQTNATAENTPPKLAENFVAVQLGFHFWFNSTPKFFPFPTAQTHSKQGTQGNEGSQPVATLMAHSPNQRETSIVEHPHQLCCTQRPTHTHKHSRAHS
jgi:hypothetical protein